MPKAQAQSQPLHRLPFSSFAMVMGLGGLANSWALAAQVFALPSAPALALLGLASALFAALFGLQLWRLLRHPGSVREEFADPMKSAFFATLSIAMVVLALGWRWILQAQNEQAMTPAWFIPVVGNILIPVAGVPLGYPVLSHFCFSVGLTLWLAFFVIALHRVLFMPTMSVRSLPTLFILLAPPSIGFLASVALEGGQINALAELLFDLALFLALLLASLLPRLLRGRFFLSWWAMTFPSCGWAMAVLVYARLRPGAAIETLAALAVLATSLLVLGIAALTLRHFWSGAWALEDLAEVKPEPVDAAIKAISRAADSPAPR